MIYIIQTCIPYETNETFFVEGPDKPGLGELLVKTYSDWVEEVEYLGRAPHIEWEDDGEVIDLHEWMRGKVEDLSPGEELGEYGKAVLELDKIYKEYINYSDEEITK